MPPGPWWQITEHQITFTHADQSTHLISKQLRNRSNLALPPLTEDDPYPYAFWSSANQLNPGWCSHFAIEQNPVTPATQRFRSQCSIKQHPVLFFNFKAGMCQCVGQLAVIGEEN
jgi:hypothetical protein